MEIGAVRSRAIWGLASLLIAIGVLAAFAFGRLDPCVNTVILQTASPDGLRSAILFERNCGATTGYSTQVSVLATGGTPTGSGNAFRADTEHGRARPARWGGPWAEAVWLDDDRLLIRYDRRARVFASEEAVGSVAVAYDAVLPESD